MGRRLFISLAMALVTGGSEPAGAKSQRLWVEKAASKKLLAEVPDFRALAEQVVPCVVSIQVEQRTHRSSGPFPDFFDPGWPKGHRGENPGRGIGSGFAIRDDGMILTNNHVVEGADSIQVTFFRDDGTESTYDATIVGTAPQYDVALLRTEKKVTAPTCPLGDSDGTKIGDWVMAVGNPFGLSHSVSVGIVSARGRREITPSGRAGLYDFIQTDASINPGNSGGPLINLFGEVVGMNTAINAAGSGIGFAIPINMVKTLLPSLSTKGKFVRSWIGIRIQPLTESLAKSYGLERPRGALVSEVVPGSPAQSGGLVEGDIVLRFAGKPVRDQTDLPLYASMAGVGEEITVTIWREGKELDRKVVLAAYPDESEPLAEKREPKEAEGGLGLTVVNITPQLQQRFDLAQPKGVMLREVEANSPAARAGLLPGDVILALNGALIREAREFVGAVRNIRKGGHLRLQILRGQHKQFVALQKP